MKVKVEFVVETADFGKEEFKKEIEKLIKDIDSDTKLLSFRMRELEGKREIGRSEPKRWTLEDARAEEQALIDRNGPMSHLY